MGLLCNGLPLHSDLGTKGKARNCGAFYLIGNRNTETALPAFRSRNARASSQLRSFPPNRESQHRNSLAPARTAKRAQSFCLAPWCNGPLTDALRFGNVLAYLPEADRKSTRL